MANMKEKPWRSKKAQSGRADSSKAPSLRIGQVEALESRQLLSSFQPVDVRFQWVGRGRGAATEIRFDGSGNFLGASGLEADLHAGGLLGGGSTDPNRIVINFNSAINTRTVSPSDISITGDVDPANPFRMMLAKAKKNTLTLYTTGQFSTAADSDLFLQLRDIAGGKRPLVQMDPWTVSFDITADADPCNCPGNAPPRVVLVTPSADAIEVTFSEDLQAAGVNNPNSIRLVGSNGDGVFDDGDDIQFVPTSIQYNAATDRVRYGFANALPNDTYRLRLAGSGASALRDIEGLALDGNGNGVGGDDFTTTFTVNVLQTPPQVVSITPVDGATLSTSPASIQVFFNKDLNPATLNSTSFQLVRSIDGIFDNGNDAVLGATSIDYDAALDRARFFVNGTLANDLYRVRLTTGIQDTAGNRLDGRPSQAGFEDFTVTFRVAMDTTLPTVVAISPGANAVFTQTPPSAIEVQFSEDMLGSSVTNPANFTLTRSGGDSGFNNGNEVPIAPTSIEYDSVNRRARFVLSGALPNDVYLVRLRGPGGVQDLAGNVLDGNPSQAGGDDYTSLFQVNVPPPPDVTAPTVVSITPTQQKVLATAPSEIVLQFSEALDPNTISANNFRLTQRGSDASFSQTISTTISYNAATRTLRLVPNTPLAEDIHHVRINASAVRDLAGNLLDGNGDGFAGGDFVSTFAVSSQAAQIGGDPPDPFGDTTSGDGFGRVAVGAVVHDIESVGVMSDLSHAYFRGTFFGDIQPASRNLRNSLFGFFDIDSDQRFTTGAPSGAAPGDTSLMDQFGEQIAGPTTHLLGSEFYISLGSEAAHAGQVDIFGTSTGTWLLDNDGGRSIGTGEAPFVFQPLGTRVFVGNWSGTGRKSIAAIRVSTEINRSHLLYIDRDGDGRYDPNEDLDGDGVLDVQEFDLDGDGVVDPNEDLDRLPDGTPQPDGRFDRAEDLDNDGVLDNDGPFTFGNPNDFPNPIVLVGDTDGDGKDNVVLFDPATARFLIDVDGDFRDSAADVNSATFGAAGDFPFLADFDGDGLAEIAVFRPGVGFIVDADNDFEASQGDVRMSDFVSEDLNGDNIFNNGLVGPGFGPLLNEAADGRDYNNDGDTLDLVSEDLNLDGIFNNGSSITNPLLDELQDQRDYNNDGDLTGFSPPGGIYYPPLNEAADGIDYNNDGDINDFVSEDLNGDGFFNDGIVRPLLDETRGTLDPADDIDFNRNGFIDAAPYSEDLNLNGLFNVAADIPIIGDWDGITFVEIDFDGDGSEDLNGDGIFNDGQTGLPGHGPLLDETQGTADPSDDVDYNRDGDKTDRAVSEDRPNPCNAGLGVFNNGIIAPLLADPSEDRNGNCVIDGKTVDIGWFRTATSELYLNRNAAARGGFTRLFTSQLRDPSEDTNRDGILAAGEDRDPDGPGPLLPNGVLDLNDGPLPFPRFDSLIADATILDVPLGQQDFNGDGRDDAGFFRPATGQFFLDQNGDGVFQRATEGPFQIGSTPPTGFPQDVAVVGDLDGDGDSDIGVFRRRGDVIVGRAPIFYRNRSFTVKVPLGLIGETPVQSGGDADFVNFGLTVGVGPTFASMTDEVPNICPANVCNPADPPLGPFDPPGTFVPRPRPFASGPLTAVTINGVRTDLGPIVFAPPTPPTFRTTGPGPDNVFGTADDTGYPRRLIVDLSGPIDPTTVDNSTVFLVRSGGDGVFGNGNDQVVAPVSIIVSDGPGSPGPNDQIDFVLPLVPQIPGDDYRFTVRGDDPVRDVNGVPIDGEFFSFILPSGNGSAGGDFVMPLRIDRPPTITIVRLTRPDDRGLTETRGPSTVQTGCPPANVHVTDVPEVSDTGVLNDGFTSDCTPTFIGQVVDERIRITSDPISDTFGTGSSQPDLAGLSAEYSTVAQVSVTTEPTDVPTLAIALAFHAPVSLPSATAGGPSVYGFVDIDVDQNVHTGGVGWFKDLNGDRSFRVTSNLSVDPPILAEGPLRFGQQSGNPDKPVIPVVGNWFKSAVSDTTDFGLYNPVTGEWSRDRNGNGTLEIATEVSTFTGVPGRIPLVGNFFESPLTTDDGLVERGEYDPDPASATFGFFFLDINGNDVFDGAVETFAFVAPAVDPPKGQEDVPIIGDWDGNGIDDIGVYRPSGIFPNAVTPLFPGKGLFFLDLNGDRDFDISEDRNGDRSLTPGLPPSGEDLNGNNRLDLNDGPYPFGPAGARPIVGAWQQAGIPAGTRIEKVGVYLEANSNFTLDIDGDLVEDASEGPFAFGIAGDQPVVGDWNGDGFDEIGVLRTTTRQFILDFDNNHTVGIAEGGIFAGSAGTVPIVGNFDGDTLGVQEVGTFLAQNASTQSSLGRAPVSGLGVEFIVDLGSELEESHRAEDRDGDGVLDDGEDRNGNGLLDSGFVDIIDAVTGLRIDFDPVAPGIQGVPISLFPDNRGFVIFLPLAAIGEAGDGNVNLGAIVGTATQFTDETPEDLTARSSQAILVELDSDRTPDVDGPNVFPNGTVVTTGFGRFVTTVTGDQLENGTYNGVVGNFEQLAFRATDDGGNTIVRLHSVRVDSKPARILAFGLFEDGELLNHNSARITSLNSTPTFLEVTLDEPLDPNGAVQDLLNYRLLGANGLDFSSFLINVQYNVSDLPVRDELLDEDLNNDGRFNNGQVGPGTGPFLNEVIDGIDYNLDGDTQDAFLSEDRNNNGVFDRFTVPGKTIRLHLKPGLAGGVYTFVVQDTVVDLAGNLLDGENFGVAVFPPSGNGIGGGDFEISFTVNPTPVRLIGLTAVGPGNNNRIANCPGPDGISGTADDRSVLPGNEGPDGRRCTADDVAPLNDADDERNPVMRQYFDNDRTNGLEAPLAPLAFEAVFSQAIDPATISTGTAANPCAGTVILYRSGNDGNFGDDAVCVALHAFEPFDLSPDGLRLRVYVNLPPGTDTLESDYYRLTFVGGDPNFIDDPRVRFDSTRTGLPISNEDGVLRVIDTITINAPSNIIVNDMDVVLNITHQLPQDLDVYLLAPGGNVLDCLNPTSLTCVELFTDIGQITFTGAAFRDTVLNDQAGTAISSAAATVPYSGDFRPEGQLSIFNGLPLAGVWSIVMADDTPNSVTGTLDDWALIVSRGAPSVDVGPNVDVSVEAGTPPPPKGGYQGSPSIDVNRDQPLHYVAAYFNAATGVVEANYSTDDGATWKPSSPFDLNVSGAPFSGSRDAAVAFRGGATGQEVVYVGFQVNNGGVPGSGGGVDDNGIGIARSNDGGATFGPVVPVTLNRGAGADVYDDKPSIDVDRGATPNQQGNVYAAWTRTSIGPVQLQQVNFMHSTDGGVNFVGNAAAQAPLTPKDPIRVDRSVDCPDTPVLDDCTVTRFNARGGPFAIPDANTALDHLVIQYATNVLVQDVTVLLNIAHSLNEDLDVFLNGPNGQRVQLFSDVGGTGSNFQGTQLNDNALIAIDDPIAAVPPFSGVFRPEQPLAAFDGSTIAGTWTLEVIDDTFNGEVGQVLSWALIFTHPTSGGVANVSVAAATVQSGGPFYLVDTSAASSLFVDLTNPGAVPPGTTINTALNGQDDGAVAVNIPFTFDFFGTGYNSLCLTSNGLMHFTTPTSPTCNRSSNNTDLTVSGTPGEPVIAPFWDNLQFLAGGNSQVYFATFGPVGGRQFVAQWNALSGTPTSPSTLTFQVGVFESTGIIELRYLDVNSGDFRSGGNSATVGIRAANPPALSVTPNQVFQLLFNGTGGPLLVNNQAIRFTPSAQRQVFIAWEDTSRGIPADPTVPTPGTAPAPVSLIKVDSSVNAGVSWGIDNVAAVSHVNGFFDAANPTCNAESTKVIREFGSGNIGYCYLIPAQPTRGISATPQLALDPRVPSMFGPFPRMFLVYTDQGDEDLNNNNVGVLEQGEDLNNNGRLDPGEDCNLDPGEDLNNNGCNDRLHDNTDIMLTYSDDGGITWRRPIQVNDDTLPVLGPSDPATRLATRNSQFFPSISVDPNSGVLHIAWYDARRDPANKKVDVFYTTAVPDRLTGDLTFPNPNVRISTVQSDESNDNILRNPLNFGDFTSIVAINGVAHPTWTDNGLLGAGNEEIRTSRVEGQITAVTTTNLGHIEDVHGNFLDGEALGTSGSEVGLPSGDGKPGGNFVTSFIVTNNEDVNVLGRVLRRGIVVVQSNTQPDPLLPPTGSPTNPYATVQDALRDLNLQALVRPSTQVQEFTTPNVLVLREAAGQPYVIEPPPSGLDGTVRIPGFTTMVVEPGAIIKLRASNIDVGGSSPALAHGAALQLRGQGTNRPVFVTSLKNDELGGDTNRDAANSAPQAADWGGIVFRDGSDDNLSIINNSEITYAGGPVPRAIGPRFDAIYLESARPAITNNVIANTGVSALPRDAQAAISANFNSFIEDTFDRTTTGQTSGQVGPLIRNNVLRDNSLNALRLRPDDTDGTRLNFPRATLTGSRVAHWDDRDIVHVLTTEALITSGASWFVDPGLTIKLDFAAFTIGSPRTTVVIGDPDRKGDDPVVFTSVYDDSFGDDTNNDGVAGQNPVAVQPRPGDWSGIEVVGGSISRGVVVPDTETTFIMDEAVVKFAGGQTPNGQVRSALTLGTPRNTGPGFYQITRNQFIDNLESAITVQPEILRADNPKTPLVEDPLFRDNELKNELFMTQRNGLEIGRFADGPQQHQMPGGTIGLGTHSLWNDTDIVHMMGRTLIGAGGAIRFPPPVLTFSPIAAFQNASEQFWLNSLAPMQSPAELRKVDFDDFDTIGQDNDRGTLQPQFVTGNEWAGVTFVNRNLNPTTLRIDHKGTNTNGTFGCDPFVPRSSWPDDPIGIPVTNTPTPGNIFPRSPEFDVYLPFNEDENCNGIRDTNAAGQPLELDTDLLPPNIVGDGELDNGFNRNGSPRLGAEVGLNALTTVGAQNALNVSMVFSPPVHAVGFWLVGSNLSDANEFVRYFDCNGRPIRVNPADSQSAALEVSPLPRGARISAGTTNTSDIFIGSNVIDNFFIGLRSLVQICRVDIAENGGLEDNGDFDFRDTVGIDDLYFSSTPQFQAIEDPPVALTLTSLATDTELFRPNGKLYAKTESAESLVVKLGNLGYGFAGSPDVGPQANHADQLVRGDVGAGFQFGMDDNIDDESAQVRAAQDWGTGSAMRIIGVPANEATGEPGARVILTSLLDDSVGPKGAPGIDATADTDGRGLFQPGSGGGPAPGNWGDVFIGSRAAERLDQQDIPRPYDRVLFNQGITERARQIPDPNYRMCVVDNPSELVANDPCYGSIIIDADIRYNSRLRFQSASLAIEGSAIRTGLPQVGGLPGIEEEFHAITVAQSIVTNYRDFGVWAHVGHPRGTIPEDIQPYLLNNIFAFIPTRNDPTGPQVTDAVGVYIDGYVPGSPTPAPCAAPGLCSITPNLPQYAYAGSFSHFDGVVMWNTFFGNSVGLTTDDPDGPFTGLMLNNLFANNTTPGNGGQFNTFNMFFNSGGIFGDPAINFLINAPDGSRPFPDPSLFLDPNNLDFRLRLKSRGEDLNENGILDPGEDLNNNGRIDGAGLSNPAIDSALSEIDDTTLISLGDYAAMIDDRDRLVQLPSPTRRDANGATIYEMGPEKDFYGSLRQDDRRVQNIGAGGRPWFDIGAVESREFNAPVVQNTQLVAGTQLIGVAPGTPGAVLNVSPTEIIITFSEDLDPRTVTRAAFQLVDAAGAAVPISTLTFEPGTNRTTNTENTATLVPAVVLPDGTYTIKLSGFGRQAITDIDGIRLDGEFTPRGYPSGNGLPGGNFVATFSIQEAPRITKVIARNATATTALDSRFPPGSLFRLQTPPTLIEATFSEPLRTPLPPFAVIVTAAGPDRNFNTADDINIPGQFDNFDPNTLKLAFTPTSPTTLPSDTFYRVVIDGTAPNPITDLSSIPLDGENNEPTRSVSGNGVAGGDWIGYFLVGSPPPPDLTIYVDANDPLPDTLSDPQPGSIDNPFNTIREGLNAVDDVRKVVLVLPGVYFENILFDPQQHKDTTLVSRDGDRVTSIIVALNEDENCNGRRDANEPDIDSDGVLDIACDRDGRPVDETQPAVHIPNEANNVTVAGFQITTAGVHAFTGTAPLAGIGVRVDRASGAKIQRNTIYDNRTGVLLDVGSQVPAPRLENNVVWANTGPGIEVRGATNLPAEIVNNTIVFNAEGIRLTNSSAVPTSRPNVANIYNNIITGSSGAGIRSATTAGAFIDFNDVFRNLGGNYINIQRVGTHNISADPLFIAPQGRPATGRPNPLLADWRLGAFSPAIDAALGTEIDLDNDGIPDPNEDFNGNGVFDVPPALDHDRRIRYDDRNEVDLGRGVPTFIDIGAFERQIDSSGPPGSGGAGAARTQVRIVDNVLDGQTLDRVLDDDDEHDDDEWRKAVDRLLDGERLKKHRLLSTQRSR